ncbi:MAG TPA: tyrosine-type recombinase/integrase [Microbacterium sp.]|uniref:tyrosine-type recombinase/integrase n=1 Tax=Microbacterium sp. TaxID=51671 RepID=UPI002F953293
MPTRKLPSGKTQARRWDKTRSKYVSLGTFDTEEAAERAITKADLIEEMGLVPESTGTKRAPRARGREKFATYAERKLNLKRHKIKRTTFHTYSFNLQAHLMPTFGSTALADISVERVETWWTTMEQNPHGRRKAYALLNQFMKRAVKERILTENPCQVEGATKDPSKKRPTFTVGDFRMLHDMADSEQMKAMLWVLVGTGARAGEALALKWEDIDLTAGRVDIHRHRTNYGEFDGTKSHEDGRRVLMMPQEATDALFRLYKSRNAVPGDYVFLTAYGKPMSYNSFSHHFVKLKLACGLDDMHAHDLRHVHLSAFAKNATLAEVMSRAGHSDYRSALRYQHVDEERQRAIVSQMTF